MLELTILSVAVRGIMSVAVLLGSLAFVLQAIDGIE